MLGLRAGVAVTTLALLSGCGPGEGGGGFETAAEAPAPQVVFRSETYGVEMVYPENGVQGSDDATGYFDNAGWQVFAGPDQHGTRLLSLLLEGSNEITTGELRLGVSRNPEQLRQCTQPGPLAQTDTVSSATFDDVEFTSYSAGDAAMNHYQKVHAFRTLRDDTCYAIDLIVRGTNPEVYDPPKTPPFAQDEAFHRLQALLGGFSFIERK
ncbi:hypothetical protein [Alloalcanivorax mobilis]|uniref:hypothetical protein n=1 Tax=Alloalcanivorax mobilis TaxID=2019569 RepID=UPI0012FFD450|nr:hypothetical protein [Alloalcanivorax mobilis]